ncbi:DUF2283 domain-containing protein [Acidobacteria bacterium AH-259-L09]|nr:DUF2283 domain-containing protein [Acidobacteria bacterium AH-259-L09]
MVASKSSSRWLCTQSSLLSPQHSVLIDIEDGLTVDLDEQKRLIGIEILHVGHRLPPDTLATITVQNLLTATP